MQMSFQRRHFLLSYLKTMSWWPPARQAGAYSIELIWRRLILKLTVWTRECENSFFSANRILTLQGNIINSRMTSLTTRV